MTKTDNILTTERLTLRPLALGDAPAMADLGADPEVVKTLVLDWSTPEKRRAIAEDWIARAGGWEARGYGIWGVYDRETAPDGDGRLLGVCCAEEPLPRGGEGPEIYYFFSRTTWGRGIASEVTRAVVRYLLEDLGLAAVEALIFAGLNPASVRLVEKLGMRLVGRYPIADYVGEGVDETLDFELWRVATSSAEEAQRNLEEAAMKIGQFAAEGLRSEARAAAALEAAAASNGLTARLGEAPVAALVRRALVAGMAERGFLHYRVTRGAFRDR